MAAIDIISAPKTGAFASITNLVKKSHAKFQTWRNARATYVALSKLSNHELEDIGLNRGDIENLKL